MTITMTMTEERCTPISILAGYGQDKLGPPSPKRFRVSLAAALGMIVDKPTLTRVGTEEFKTIPTESCCRLTEKISHPSSTATATPSHDSGVDDEECTSMSSGSPLCVLPDTQSPRSRESSRAASYEQEPYDALSRASTAVTCSSPCSSKLADEFEQPAQHPTHHKLVSVCTSWSEQRFHEALSFTSSNGYEE